MVGKVVTFALSLNLLLIAGCMSDTDKIEVTEEVVFTCKDTRDGEVFSFNNTDVTKIEQNIFTGYERIHFKDTQGLTRYIDTDMLSTYLKCTGGK